MNATLPATCPRVASTTLFFGLVSACALGLLAGCAGSQQATANRNHPAGVMVSGVPHGRFHGAEPATPYRMPDITLTASNDEPFNLVHDTAYPVTLVFFGYTHCPDVCPQVLSEVTAALQRVPPAARAKTQLLFVTTDPRRDTPSVLRGYLARFDKRFVGLTGPMASILQAANAMGVAISGMHRLPGGGYEVGHGAQVIGFRGNRAPVVWTQGTPVSAMAADITALTRG
jgi:protein SCO1